MPQRSVSSQNNSSFEVRRERVFPWYPQQNSRLAYLKDFIDWAILEVRIVPYLIIASFKNALALNTLEFL